MSKSLALLPLLNQVKGVLKPDNVKIDSFIPQLHYRVTGALLLASCLLVSSHHYFGKPIQCVQDVSGENAAIPENVINTFCFIQSTYTNPKSGHFGDNQRRDPSSIIHTYYQWTPLVLFLGAIVVAAPHYFWQYFDDGFMAACMKGVQVSLDQRQYKKPVSSLAWYLSRRFHSLGTWALGHYLQDVFITVNAIILFLCTDLFLGGSFLQYGSKVLNSFFESKSYRDVDWPHRPGLISAPMDRVFPKMTKCEFSKFGPSGTIQRHDALCLLAINIINDKVFLGAWYWLLFLFFISGVALVIRSIRLLALILRKRCGVLKKLTSLYDGSEETEFLLSHLHIGDIIFLEQVQMNMDKTVFKYLIQSICDNMTDSPRESFSENIEA